MHVYDVLLKFAAGNNNCLFMAAKKTMTKEELRAMFPEKLSKFGEWLFSDDSDKFHAEILDMKAVLKWDTTLILISWYSYWIRIWRITCHRMFSRSWWTMQTFYNERWISSPLAACKPSQGTDRDGRALSVHVDAGDVHVFFNGHPLVPSPLDRPIISKHIYLWRGVWTQMAVNRNINIIVDSWLIIVDGSVAARWRKKQLC